MVVTVFGVFFFSLFLPYFLKIIIYIYIEYNFIYIHIKYLQTPSFTINLKEESKSTACHNILYHQIIYNEISESRICTIKFPVYEQRGGKKSF